MTVGCSPPLPTPPPLLTPLLLLTSGVTPSSSNRTGALPPFLPLFALSSFKANTPCSGPDLQFTISMSIPDHEPQENRTVLCSFLYPTHPRADCSILSSTLN